KPDMVYGFHKVLKHYYLQGLHQVVVNADLYINGDVYNGLSDHQKKAIEVAANASMMKTVAYRILVNGKALQELTSKHGVQVHDTPDDYFRQYMAAAKTALQKYAEENAFFKRVFESQEEFAKAAITFWAPAQRANANLGAAYVEAL